MSKFKKKNRVEKDLNTKIQSVFFLLDRWQPDVFLGLLVLGHLLPGDHVLQNCKDPFCRPGRSH